MSDPQKDDIVLDDDAEAMLAAFRSEEQLPAALQARVWSRVEADTETDDGVLAGVVVGPWPRRAVVGIVAAAAAVALVWVSADAMQATDVAGPVQATHEARLERPAGEMSPASDGTATRKHAAGRAEDGATAHEDAEASTTLDDVAIRPKTETETETKTKAVPRGRRKRRPPVAEQPDVVRAPRSTLGDEIAMLDRARKALLAHAPNKAASILREHTKAFPKAAMAQERRALLAIAVCEGSGHDAGQGRAKSFLREHPTAALADRVRSACGIG
ncbi:MAG: hypothetical protein JKY37_16545 [Nannocystaceae bacterium]|nr:hypothetical protein [Nannocystaceae bacterium]